jgi:hypothetical protein
VSGNLFHSIIFPFYRIVIPELFDLNLKEKNRKMMFQYKLISDHRAEIFKLVFL